jgi:choice-of-anchor A domain-containing protein
MKLKQFAVLLPFAALSHLCLADPLVPFGAASTYTLVALGTTGMAGNIATNSDVTGRIAAANTVGGSITIGSALANPGADPYASLATYGLVAQNGLAAGTQINMNGGGSAYAPGSNGSFNFNDGGSRVTSGSSGIDFNGLRTQLDAQSLFLSTLAPTGTVVGINDPNVSNPSFFVLQGTNPTLNVFTITQAEFGDTNHPLDIVAPAGSTVIINVQGSDPTLGTGIYFNGTEESDSNNDNGSILFNFATATSVAIDGQLDGALLAPFAELTGTNQMGGTFIAAAIGSTGEVHNLAFEGTLPSDPSDPSSPSQVPEPGSIVLMGSGLFTLAAVVRRRAKAL